MIVFAVEADFILIKLIAVHPQPREVGLTGSLSWDPGIVRVCACASGGEGFPYKSHIRIAFALGGQLVPLFLQKVGVHSCICCACG